MTQRRRILLTIALATGLLLAGGALLAWLGTSGRLGSVYRLPRDLKDQTKFAVYVPAHLDTSPYRIKPESVKLSRIEGEGVLNFILIGPGHEITISQQAYPDALIYDKFTNSLNPDAEAGTDLGNLVIGHPVDAKGHQVAGLRVGDTLLLGRPTADLTPDQWRAALNTLELAK